MAANQIEFMNTAIDHLTERGQMVPALLYESPFADLNSMGVAGVFGLDEQKAVTAILKETREAL